MYRLTAFILVLTISGVQPTSDVNQTQTLTNSSVILPKEALNTTNSTLSSKKIHELTLGVDYEYSINEHESLKLTCPIDPSKETNWEEEQEDENDEYASSDWISGESSGLDEPEYDGDFLSESSSGSDFVRKRRDKSAAKQIALIQWYKDKSKLSKFKSARYEMDGESLTIEDVAASDAGQYRCKFISGFGTSTTSALNIRVNGEDRVENKSREKVKSNGQKAPVFVGVNKSGARYRFRKPKGANIRFNCRAVGAPKPDILWYKNGEVLSEEDYGITRSKWVLDLKDLRMEDNANFTCKVSNKHGFINSTFELTVYEESQIFEGLDPLNATITAGMDAVFNCKVKSTSQPNIKWMKQISKSEYKNYIIQEASNQEGSQKPPKLVATSENTDDLNSFFALSTLPAFGVVEKSKLKLKSDEMYFSDLIERKSEENDEFKFDLYVSESPDSSSSPSLESYLNSLALKRSGEEQTGEEESGDDESSHYITLSSSQVEEHLSYDPDRHVYVSQLILKQAQVKDSGVYVCFGASNRGYSYRKSHLKVIPTIRIPSGKDFSIFNYDDLSGVKIGSKNKGVSSSPEPLFNFQSIGLFIILVPVVLITILALFSICYLRRLDSNQHSRCFFFTPFMRREKKQNPYLCCPTMGHMLMPDSSSYEPEIEFIKHHKRPMYDKNSSAETSLPTGTNHSSLGSSSLSDSASSSSSTTATTVAYYATIPLLLNDSQSPPPLPQSHPPTFSPAPPPNHPHYRQQTSTIDPRFIRPPQPPLTRTDSTPSMAYYKIVDSDLVRAPLAVDNDDNMTCVSTATSRFYYQLAPVSSHTRPI